MASSQCQATRFCDFDKYPDVVPVHGAKATLSAIAMQILTYKLFLN